MVAGPGPPGLGDMRYGGLACVVVAAGKRVALCALGRPAAGGCLPRSVPVVGVFGCGPLSQ